MTTEAFCYWLQGLFELTDIKTLNEKQVDLIRRHLNLVFIHEIDPKMDAQLGVHPAISQAIHDGTDIPDLPIPIGPIMGQPTTFTSGISNSSSGYPNKPDPNYYPNYPPGAKC